VTAGTSETCNQTFSYWVSHTDHEHRHRRIEVLRRANTGWRVRQDHAHFLLGQFAGKYWKERIVTPREVRFKDNVATDHQSVIAKTLKESIALGMILRRAVAAGCRENRSEEAASARAPRAAKLLPFPQEA
jgi:hypothetical protein